MFSFFLNLSTICFHLLFVNLRGAEKYLKNMLHEIFVLCMECGVDQSSNI